MNNLLLQLNNNQLRRFKKMNNVLNINKIIILNNNTPPKKINQIIHFNH